MATQQFEDIEDVPQVQVEEDISQTYGIIQNIKHILAEKEVLIFNSKSCNSFRKSESQRKIIEKSI